MPGPQTRLLGVDHDMTPSAAEPPPALARPLRGSGVMAGTMHPASFGSRVAAALIDFVILQVAMALVQGLFVQIVMRRLDITGILLGVCGPVVVGAGLTLFYSVWLESSAWQGTLGKRVLGLKVVTLEGQRISFGRSTSRNIAKSCSALILGVGYLMPLWTQRRQALHDIMAACVVVRSAEPAIRTA